jgi:hypothetical protein
MSGLLYVVYHKRRAAPRQQGRLDALFLEMLAKSNCLVVIEPDEHPAMASPTFSPRFNLIQDQLKPLQANFKGIFVNSSG